MALSITIRPEWNVYRIQQYKDGAYGSAVTDNFDYFDDDCSVGDCIVFIGSKVGMRVWDELKLNVDTAFSATSYTMVWEYWKVSTREWVALSNVVDNTNSLSTTGTNTVTWDIPTDWGWQYSGVPVTYTYAVRCRLTAVDTPTEGGFNGTAPTYRPRTIQVENGVEDEYGHFEEIYQACVSAGSNLVTRSGAGNETYKYDVDCTIYVPSGSFGSRRERVEFSTIGTFYMVKNNNVLWIGDEADGDNLKYGAEWFFNEDYGSQVCPYIGAVTANIYGSTFIKRDTGATGSLGGFHLSWGYVSTLNVKESILYNNMGSMYFYYNRTYNFDKSHVSQNVYLFPDTGTPVDFNGTRIQYAQFRQDGGKVRNLIMGTLRLLTANITTHFYDVEYEDFMGKDDNTFGVFYHNLDLTVVDRDGVEIAGATVTIRDKNDDEVDGSPFTTDGDGNVVTDIKVSKHWGSGTPPAHSETYSPHTVIISKDGYKTITRKYTLSEKTTQLETLSPEGTVLQDVVLYSSTIY